MSDRQARCAYCQKVAPSDPGLPFFEFRGEGSKAATQYCKCGYHMTAHVPAHGHVLDAHKRKLGKEPATPRGPHEFDSYYCGCRGWD